jgi:hypothetical protein
VSRTEGGRPTKAIVFTQFWQHMMLIEPQLKSHGVLAAVLRAAMKMQEKADAVRWFKVRAQSSLKTLASDA